MDSSTLQIAAYVLGGALLGAAAAWLIQVVLGKRRIAELTTEARVKIAEVTAQRDGFGRQNTNTQAQVEKLRAANARLRRELKSMFKKSKLLARNVLTLRTEREDTKLKVGTLQNALVSLKQQSVALQTEFEKSREFYKRELLKSLQKRKELDQEIIEARAEQEEFAKLVESSVLEHGSEEDMVVAAQLRLGQLEVLTRNVNKLETENEQLRQDARQIKQELEQRDQNLAELDQLRIHNKQLVKCVEALESSRKQHETEADRYREQADQSEKLSDTLRLKLDDLEKNFADIEQQQDQAIKKARQGTVVPMVREQR
jgi:DNA repair exonuclease SbcCD ATPase subunit